MRSTSSLQQYHIVVRGDEMFGAFLTDENAAKAANRIPGSRVIKKRGMVRYFEVVDRKPWPSTSGHVAYFMTKKSANSLAKTRGDCDVHERQTSPR